ncbi:SdpA family antimicrobial peptide system protein [Cryobacterium algoricola]|uniref:SdpA family antimicrobial peptide system protein n=1 Tax=Cryobacterium algoricola TaxID=1259183 RepID=UPI003B97BF6B
MDGAKGAIQAALPQGWAFFTRSPEDPSLVPYVTGSDGTWNRADTLPQGSVTNLFGLSRNQRAQGTELALIVSRVPKLTACDDYLSECLAMPVAHSYSFANPTSSQFFCGPLRVVLQTPVKWSFRNETPEEVRAEQFVDIDISCGKAP